MGLDYGYGPATDRQEGIKVIRGALTPEVVYLAVRPMERVSD